LLLAIRDSLGRLYGGPDIEEILKEAGINGKTILYGLEDIVTGNVIWKIFSIIKRLTPAFAQFYKLPSFKLPEL
jgi:KUP system potassium uptake protein